MADDTQQKTPFAVIETGGKQYKVAAGDVIAVEKMEGEFNEGDTVTFDKVLLVDDGKDTEVGEPYLEGKKVTGEFTAEGKGKKLNIMRFHPKSRYTRRVGHRQPYNRVKITQVK